MIKTKTQQNRNGVRSKAFLRNVSVGLGLAFLSVASLTQAGQGPQPTICNRACWGARAPQCSISQMASLTRAILHHTGSAAEYSTDYNTSKAKCRGNQSYVMDSLGYCDGDYHFWVDAAGNIFEGRSGSMSSLPRGSHDGCNANSFGFAVLGNFETQGFPTVARNSLEAIIAWRMPSAWSATGSGTYCSLSSIGTLDGHYRVKATDCPGANIIPLIPGIRTGVMNRKNGIVPPAFVPSAGQRVKGDFTGDGKDDVMLAYDYSNGLTGLWMFSSTGSSFAPQQWWSSGAGNWEAPRTQWVAGDFNNDGKADVAALYDYGSATSKLLVFISTGTGFAAPAIWWSSGAGNMDAQRVKMSVGDFNADGRKDVAMGYDYGNARTAALVFISTGTAFSNWVNWWDSGVGGMEAPRCKWVSGDFNADGKTDLATAYDYGSGRTALFVLRSTGTAFSPLQSWWDSGVGGLEGPRAKWVSGDFNADGKVDVAAAYDYGNARTALLVFRSTGTTFNTWQNWWDSGVGTWEAPRTQWVSGDFNGDGKTDVTGLYNYGNSYSALFTFSSSGSAFAAPARWWDNNGGWDATRSIGF